MFLSKRFSFVETKYWLTKFEIIGVIWIIKKMRHFIKSCKKSPMSIFTNHAIIAEIVNQIFLTTANTNKFNLRLIRVSQFLFTFFIRIKIKSDKFHVVSNVLSRLKSTAIIENTSILKNLNDVKCMIVKNMMIMSVVMKKKLSWNVKFHFVHEILNCQLDESIFFMKMSEEFFSDLKQVYRNDDQWFRFKIKLKIRTNFINIFDDIEFILKGNHVYFVFENITSRLCISWFMKKIIFETTYDENHHCDFHRVYVRIFEFLYIRHLVKKFKKYIKHCKKCIENQIVKHVFYDELHSIKSIALFFHIIIIDFIFVLSEFSNDMNSVFITTNKFSKRINLMSNKITWFASKWTKSWLIMFQKKSWNLCKTIIFDRNSKFVISFWKTTFHHLKIALLYITIYHFQANEQSERTNQIVKIALKYFLMKNDVIDFITLSSSIQAVMNNSTNVFTDVFSNEIFYKFKILKVTDLLNNDVVKTKIENDISKIIVEKKRVMLKKKAENAIIHAQIMFKIRYDFKHKSIDLKTDQKIYIKLHWNYFQFDLKNRKYSKQRLKSINILKKINRLIYKLKISKIWKIHFVISMTHLESALFENDSYEKQKIKSDSIEIDDDDDSNFYEIEKIIAKRVIYIGRERRRRAFSQFRMKWLKWKNHHNRWLFRTDFKNVRKLLQKFKNRNRKNKKKTSKKWSEKFSKCRVI